MVDEDKSGEKFTIKLKRLLDDNSLTDRDRMQIEENLVNLELHEIKTEIAKTEKDEQKINEKAWGKFFKRPELLELFRSFLIKKFEDTESTKDERVVFGDWLLDVEISLIRSEIRKSETDPKLIEDKVTETYIKRDYLGKIQRRIDMEELILDRINISEYRFDERIDIFTSAFDQTRARYKNILEKDKIWDQILEEKKGVSDTDLPEHLMWLPTESEHVLGLIGDRFKFIGKNYYKLKPPRVCKYINIPEHIRKIYAESRWCYVFQNYCAAVALCRTILEIIIKDKEAEGISISSVSYFLDTMLKDVKISEKAYKIGKNVIGKANKVLHDGMMIDEAMALNVIEKTKEFLEEIYSEKEM